MHLALEMNTVKTRARYTLHLIGTVGVPVNGSTRSTTIPLFPEEWFVKLPLVWTGDSQVAGTHLRP